MIQGYVKGYVKGWVKVDGKINCLTSYATKSIQDFIRVLHSRQCSSLTFKVNIRGVFKYDIHVLHSPIIIINTIQV